MKWFTYTLVLILSVISLGLPDLVAQEPHPGIHQRQHEKYKNMTFQEEIPGLEKGYVPLQQPTDSLPKIVFGFHPYWNGTSWQGYHWNLISTLAYFGVDVNSAGNITNLHGWPVTSLINTAHSHGVKVVLVAILFSSSSISSLLNSSSARANLVSNLVNTVSSAGADGVNIDFEGMPSGQRANFVNFMTSLTTAMHNEIPGSDVTIDMPAVNWSDNFNVSGLANACDGLMIMGYDYYWKGSSTTGPVSPLYGGSINVSSTISYYTSNVSDRSKLILGLPYYGYQWPASSSAPGASTTGTGTAKLYETAEGLAQSYGKQRYTAGGQIPWYRYQGSSNWVQGWYDDSLSLSLKYQAALQADFHGIGIWALGYDGDRPELWQALADNIVQDSIPPIAPVHFYVSRYRSANSVKISFSPVNNALKYRIYNSLDGLNFTLYRQSYDTEFLVNDLPVDTLTYLKVTAVNGAGESQPTEVLGIVPGDASPRALIVNGFDRVGGTNNTHDFIRQHGSAVWANGVYFDAASNEAVITGKINLNNYDMVDWILGEEGTSTSSFSPEEQAVVKTYLEGGGKFFVSGSEIGYDLVAQGSSADQAFYQEYLKAQYVTDAAGGPHSFYPAGDTIFDGLGTISFDDGTHGTYNVDYPDGIKPAGGASIALEYDENTDYNSEGGAGIVYEGHFGMSNQEGKLVYISPGFETIYPANSRNALMGKIIQKFQPFTGVTPENKSHTPLGFRLIGAYPNPFNATATITFETPAAISAPVNIAVYDLTGRKVRMLLNEVLSEGQGEVVWNGKNDAGQLVATGTYLVVAHAGNRLESLKLTLLK